MITQTLLSLLSVLFGWALARVDTGVSSWRTSQRLKEGLLTELRDIHQLLNRSAQIHIRQLQIYAHNGIEANSSLPIPNFFFQQYFKDVIGQLDEQQRSSYQLIHSTLGNLNTKEAALQRFADDLSERHQCGKLDDALKVSLNPWGTKLRDVYLTVLELKWHVERHLKRPDGPMLDIDGPVHGSYQRFLEASRN